MHGQTNSIIATLRKRFLRDLCCVGVFQLTIATFALGIALGQVPSEQSQPTVRNPNDETKAVSDTQSNDKEGPTTASEDAIEKGRTEQQQNRWAQALEHFGEAITTSPNDPAGYWYRARAFQRLGRTIEAAADFERVVELVDKRATLRAARSRAYALMELGRWEEAVKDLNHALSYKADDVTSLLYRGRCFDKLGRYKEAIDDYSQVIETSPKLAEASLCRGNTHVRAGRFREGLADQKRAIRLGGIREGDLIHRDAENGALFRFVFVPPGHYLVGFSKEQRVSSAIQSRQLLFGHNATPVTEVDLRKGFFILDREVTKLQYNVSDGQKPEQISKQPSDDEPLRLGAKEPKTDATPESADQSQQPIANISWLEAMEFCETMQRQLGLVTRLPTEIEWECAGRHQQDWLYPWDGNVFHAWAGKKEEDASPRILDAKKNRDITPNGIHDMSGNLSEWCLNEYRNSLFKEGNKNITYTPVPFSIQQRTVAIQPDLQATFRSYRGGSYRDDRFNCQLPARRALNASDRLPSIGFRIVLLPRFSK